MHRLLPNYVFPNSMGCSKLGFGVVFRIIKIVGISQTIILPFLQLCLIANKALNKTEN